MPRLSKVTPVGTGGGAGGFACQADSSYQANKQASKQATKQASKQASKQPTNKHPHALRLQVLACTRCWTCCCFFLYSSIYREAERHARMFKVYRVYGAYGLV